MGGLASMGVAMMIRAVGVPMLRSLGLVTGLCGGIVALAISVEQATSGFDVILSTMAQQIPTILVWLAPWLVGASVGLAWMQMDVRGEIRALACSGLGVRSTVPIVVGLGVLVGGVSLALAEWWIPGILIPDLPPWVWTLDGPQRTADGLVVLINEGGKTDLRPIPAHAALLQAPRTAPLALLVDWASPAAQTEWYARLARTPACVGFGLLGLYAAQLGRPLLRLMAVCGVLVVLEAVAWRMGSQGQLSPWLAGGIPSVAWVVPWLWLKRQSWT
jgi:hypothetical protein